MTAVLDALGWLALIVICYLLIAVLALPLWIGRRTGLVQP
jgi:hypothetical protein